MSSTAPNKNTWPPDAKAAKTIVADVRAGRVSVDVTDSCGHTVLMLASWYGWVDDVAFLVNAGADVNAADNNGNTALMEAATHKHIPVVDYLLHHGANIDCRDNLGSTPLIAAAFHSGDLAVVQCLVEAGADIHAHDRDGKTALDIAHRWGLADIAAYLKDMMTKAPQLVGQLRRDNAGLITTIAERDATIKQLNDRLTNHVNEKDVNHRELQVSYEEVVRELTVLKERLSRCACPHTTAYTDTPEATDDMNYPEVLPEPDGAGAIILYRSLSDTNVNSCEDPDAFALTIAATPVTFASVKSCLDEIQVCYASVKEGLARLSVLESSGIAFYSYAWNTDCHASGLHALQLVEDKCFRAVKDIVRTVHMSLSGSASIGLTEFTVPIPGVSMTWIVATVDDMLAASDTLLNLSSWFDAMIGASLHGAAPAPWLVTATQNMQQLRNLCQRYEQACISDDRATFAAFTRLCVRKQVFTPAARSLLHRLKASDDVGIRSAADAVTLLPQKA